MNENGSNPEKNNRDEKNVTKKGKTQHVPIDFLRGIR